MLNPELYRCLHDDLSKYLSREELEMMISHNRIMPFNEGQVILDQGKFSQGIYLIINGIVNVTAKLLGEGTTNLETLVHGNFMGEASFIEKIPCPTSMIASNDVECLFLSKTYIEFLTAYYPQTKFHLYKAISAQVCSRIKQVNDKIVKVISASEMTPKPLFGEIIQSLTKPVEIKREEATHIIDHLQQLPLFQAFQKDEISELLKHTILMKAPKNCTLIKKGDPNVSSYIVIQGAVQSSIVHENKTAKLSVIGPGTLFTSITCEDTDLSYTITFTTCEESILVKFSDTELSSIQQNLPTVWYKLYDLICRSLVALEKSVDKLDIRLNIETYNR